MFQKFFLIMTLLSMSVNGLASESASAPALAPPRATGKYVSQWIAFPQLTLKNLDSAEPLTRTVPKGRIQLVVFIASWSIPSQRIIDEFTALEAKHKQKYTDLIFVFAHDTEEDARGFAKAHKIEDRAYLGTAKLLQDFHQPDLPSVYASDRYGWLAYRKIKVEEKDLVELDTFITKHSSF